MFGEETEKRSKMAKKFYAVRVGKTPGIYQTWEECKASVDRYPSAEYKGFTCLADAKRYLGSVDVGCAQEAEEVPPAGTLRAYVDGSYEDSLKKYAFGCVFILPDGRIYTECGNGDREQSLQHRNVTGEMLGAMYAVKTAMMNGFTKVELKYDYEGIEKWVTGEWRSKTELTQTYAKSMREWAEKIQVKFTKVPAHANVFYNELADEMAKTGLVEGNGVPKVRALEDMRLWKKCD